MRLEISLSVFPNSGDCDQVEIDPEPALKIGIFACHLEQMRALIARSDRYHIDVGVSHAFDPLRAENEVNILI